MAPACLIVKVPEGTVIYIGEFRSLQAGEVRQYLSPPLPFGKELTYEINASLGEEDNRVAKTKIVSVAAGRTTIVDFGKLEPLELPPPEDLP